MANSSPDSLSCNWTVTENSFYEDLVAATNDKDEARIAKLRDRASDSLARSDHVRAFLRAIREGRVEVIKRLKASFGITAADARESSNYAIRYAVQNSQLEVLKCLKGEFGLSADDARDDGNFALVYAASRGNLDIIKCLRDDYGLTADDVMAANKRALKVASVREHAEVYDYLTKWIAAVYGDSAIHLVTFRHA